jgi:hypothetical protein
MGGSIRSGEGGTELHDRLQLGQDIIVERDARSHRVAADVRRGAAAADRRRNTRLRQHPGNGKLRHADAAVLGDPLQPQAATLCRFSG